MDKVGEIVKVYWENEEQWFQGEITAFNPIKGLQLSVTTHIVSSSFILN